MLLKLFVTSHYLIIKTWLATVRGSAKRPLSDSIGLGILAFQPTFERIPVFWKISFKKKSFLRYLQHLKIMNSDSSSHSIDFADSSKMKHGRDEVGISTYSFLYVLEGVAVAIKCENGLKQQLSEYISEGNRFCESQIPQCNDEPQSEDTCANNLSNQFRLLLTPRRWRSCGFSALLTQDNELSTLTKLVLGVAIWREYAFSGGQHKKVDLDVVWELMYEALTGPQGDQMHFSASRGAQGFVLVPLCSLVEDGRIVELFRFHIWLPDGKRGFADVTVHAHNAFGQSWILAGYGSDHTFEVEPTSDPYLATHSEYALTWSDGKQSDSTYKVNQVSSTVSNTGRHFQVIETGVEHHTRDMTYSIPSGVYHRSYVPRNRLHATLFLFDSKRGFSDNAPIIGPKDGTQYTHVRDYTELNASSLAEVVEATRTWEKSQGALSVEADEHSTVIEYCRHYLGPIMPLNLSLQNVLPQFSCKVGSQS